MAINIPGSSNTQTIVKTPEQTIQEQLKQATPEAPEGPVTPPASRQTSIFADLNDTVETMPEGEGEAPPSSPVQEMPVEEQPNVELQQQIMEAPDLFERQRIGLEEQAQGIDTRRYRPLMRKKEVLTEDGGLFDRATNFTETILSGEVSPSGVFHPKPLDRGQIRPETSLGSLGQIINKLGAVQDNVVAPDFLTMTSIVTENQIADLVLGADREINQSLEAGLTDEQQMFEFNPFSETTTSGIEPNRSVKKAQGNAKLGMAIADEWQRFTGVQAEPLSRQEAETLGDAVKELYYEVNKGSDSSPLIKREIDSDGMVNFVVTPLGNQMFRSSDHMRKMMFPKEHVRPLDQSRYEKSREVKKKVRYSGQKKTDVPLKSETLLKAKEHLESIGHMVDSRRLKILWSTLLPALSGDPNIPLPILEMVTEIHSMGPSKIKEFEAKAKLATVNNEKYDPVANMAELQRSIAQSAYGIAKERQGVKYLTYFIQAYNGRLTPEQTHFNPTTSKQVRFVTVNPSPVIFKAGANSRQEQNLIQMYAMMLVKDADALLPEGRRDAYIRNESRLAAMGNRLKEALTMTDAESEAISQAIENGIAINDPNFPKLNGLGLDPKKDSDLIQMIKDKGEDGPAFIDGLIDVANYVDAKKDNTQFRTHFNAYIDGKTNGIASNAMQLGNKELAFRVGVLRSEGSLYAIDNDMDIRADLAQQLSQALVDDGFPDGLAETVNPSNMALLHDIAYEVFNYKPLNKKTTMTYGYGKEIDNFRGDMIEALTLLITDPSLTKNHKDTGLIDKIEVLAQTSLKEEGKSIEEGIVDQLFPMYSDKLAHIMTKEGAAARLMMHGASLFHVMMDELFEIKSPIGLALRYGGMESLGADVDKSTEYAITSEGERRKVRAFHYESRASSAAIRSTAQGAYIGGYAFGGSIPGPVQSIDAATVALSLTGQSWDNLNKASNGNPYVHTIYDAFKLDANGYDVALRDINNAWLRASMEWSYLEETRDAMNRSLKNFDQKIKSLPDAPISIGMDSPFRKIGQLLNQEEGESGMYRKELWKLLKRMGGGRIDANDAVDKFNRSLEAAGISRNDSPKELTPRQIHKVVKELMAVTQYQSRLDNIINYTNKKKQELMKEIKARGEDIYQYYTH